MVDQTLPVFRIATWFDRRRKLCVFCRNAPKVDGSRYCSDSCSEFDAAMQAHA